MSRSTESKRPWARAVSSWSVAAMGMLAMLAMLAMMATGCSGDQPVADAGGVNDASAAGDVAAGPVCPTETGPLDPTLLMDDFEDSDANMPLIAGRAGSWYTSGDTTPGAIMKPSGLAAPELIPGGRCGSRRALHVTGSGFTDWGSQVDVALHSGQDASGAFAEQPYDALARGYQGVSFFARLGDTSTANVRFVVSDEYARPEAGLCVANGTQGNGCYDAFGVPLIQGLSTTWKEFRIPWIGLSQENFGLVGGSAPDTSKLYEMGFKFPGGVIFDLWIDDIRFY